VSARLTLASEADVVAATLAGRALARSTGLSEVEAQHVATALSEVATNAWRYARGGEVVLERLEEPGRVGVGVEVRDAGPGIADVEAAMRDGVSTGGGLGLGLPGARRLMDEFDLRSGRGGTVVRMVKWVGGESDGGAAARWELRPAGSAVPFARPFRNGLLFGLAAGTRAEDAAACCVAQAWRPPAALAGACAGLLGSGERLGLALASVSTLDGGLAWLCVGSPAAALMRWLAEGRATFLPPSGGAALERGGATGLAAQSLPVRRDDVLVLADGPLDDDRLGALAAGSAAGQAACVVRFERGALEPRRP
jgi:serine/threonine-protein kinase RsbT